MANHRTTHASYKAEEDNKQRPNIVDEKRSLLLKHYCDYHSNDANEISKESLVKQSREFLTSVTPEERFLNLDVYRKLKQISENLDKNIKTYQESISRITSGFKSLEQYGVNLWRFPWRKEYHTIKLYTAFFKNNIEQQLQDRDAIFDMLESLGYTVRGQQEVSNNEPNRDRAIWMSMELFLVQVDLQLLKEIIDRVYEREFSLKDIVKVRSETRDVEDAISCLERKAAKRRKREEPRGVDVSSHWNTKHTHAEPIDNVHSDATPSDANASADQTAMRKPKRTMSKGRDDVAADADDSSLGSSFSKRKPSGGPPPFESPGECYYHSQQLPDHELYGVSPEGSQMNGVTQYHVNTRYRTFPQAGSSYASKRLNCPLGHSTVSQVETHTQLSQLNLDESSRTFPQSGSSFETNQDCQDARFRTAPQTRPLYNSDITKRSQYCHGMPHSGRPLYTDSTKDGMDSAMAASRSVSHHETITPLHLSHQYSSERPVGSLRDDTRGHAEVTQRNTVLPLNKVVSETNGYHSNGSSRTETHVHWSASGDTRYANLTNSYTGQTFGSNESDKRLSTKESARRHDDRDAKYGTTGATSSEPMVVKQTENSRASRNDAVSLHNEMTEPIYGKTTVQPRVTELNDTLMQQLTFESNTRLPCKESQQFSSTSSVQGRQHGSERVTGTPEATGSRVRATREARPTRLLHQSDNNVTTNKAISKSGSSAADPKGSSPGPSQRTSAHQDQIPGTSSDNNLHSEISRERSFVEKDTKGAAICIQCGLQGTVICRNCLKIVCRECEKIYATDLCEATKGEHGLVTLKASKMPQKTSGDPKAYSSQEAANTDDASGNGNKDWPCSRCTYLNAPEHRICVICGASRGIGVIESAKPGSRVCKHCTLHNEEAAVVCRACNEPLTKSETVV